MHLLKSPWLRGLACFIVGLLLVWGLSAHRGQSAIKPLLPPLPQDPYIQVFFNQNPASVYTDPYRHITRYGDNLEQVIIDAINQSQSSIDIAVHEFTLPEIAVALRQKAAAGVKVRLIFENSYSQGWGNLPPTGAAQLDEHDQNKFADFFALVDQNQDGTLDPTELSTRDAHYILQQAGIPMLDDTADGSKGSGLMHHKFMVIDRHLLVTGSTNWTLSDTHGDFAVPESRGNANGLLVIESPALAQVFADEFSLMWGDGPGKQPDSQFGLQKPYRPARLVTVPGSGVEVQFSPTSQTRPQTASVNGLIAKTLGSSTQQIDLALFVFSDQTIGNQLATTASKGVQIRTLIDPGFAYRSYSEALDMMGLVMADHRCRYESQNQPWTAPLNTVGIPTLPEGDKLHHKFAVIDHTRVVIGSHNWSEAANQTNDENLLVIRNSTVAAHFQREFERLYASAELGVTPALQHRLEEHRQQCQ